MPKNIHKINRFEGGINEGSAQRDIKENQAVNVKNLSIHTIGSLKVLGGFIQHEATEGTVTEEISGTSDRPGYGLFSFQSDYKMLDASAGSFLTGASSLVGASKYLLTYSTTNGGSAAIFQNNGGTKVWSDANDVNDEIDLGGTVADLVYYSYNGGVRIADASGTANNSIKWLGVITPKVYGNHTPVAGDGTTGSGQTYQQYGIWYTRNEASVYRTSSEQGTTSIGSTEARWLRLNSSIAGAFPEEENDDGISVCTNAIMANTETKGDDFTGITLGAPTGGTHNMESAGFGFANETNDVGSTHKSNTNNNATGMYWGVGCHFREGKGGTWMPSTSTRYKFYITTMYDDMTQESLPQLMAMYGAQNLVPDYTPASCDITVDGSPDNVIHDDAGLFLAHGFAVGQTVTVTDEDNPNNTFTSAYISAVDEDEMTLLDGPSGSVQDFGTAVSNYGKITIKGHDDCDYTAVATANDNVSFAYSSASEEIYFCDGSTTGAGLEGDCNEYGTPGTNLRAWFNPIIKIVGAPHGLDDSNNNPNDSNCYVFGNGNATANDTYGNPRISGFRIYWASNEDGYSTLYQIMEGDFAKGLQALGLDGAAGASGYAPWQHYSIWPPSETGGLAQPTDARSGVYLKADWPTSNRWIHPPRIRTYFENNHHEHDDTINVDYYKTAVVANDRVFIGNVVQTIDGVQERFPDRILKSPYGQPDKFPSENKLQIGDNDGDSIVHLATFADRILQFNNNVMYIINIAQDQEYVEDIHKFKGVHHSASVCQTDNGIVWANENGVYIYTGKEVRNILELEGSALIDSGTWKNFVTNAAGNIHPMVGYSAKRREVLVVDDIGTNGDGHMYIFNANTGGWTYAPSAVGDAVKTNFTLDYNNDLIYFDYSDDTMRKWDNTASQKTGAGAVQYTTKEIDFGQPAIRKKIYKVYVTHKGSASNIQMSYAINGQTNFTNVGSTFPESANSGAGYTTTSIDMNISGSTDVYSIQLKFTSTGTVPANFEINDISIVYRSKTIK